MKAVCIIASLALAACDRRDAREQVVSQEGGYASATDSGAGPKDRRLKEGVNPREESRGSGPADGLCVKGEVLLFECPLRKRSAAVCAGRTSTGRAYAQYRNGDAKRLDLAYPKRLDEGVGSLAWASMGYSGGGESQLRFMTGGFDYVVYSRIVRTGFGPDGHFDPVFEAGVFVKRGGRLIADHPCSTVSERFGNVDTDAAARFMPRGEFVDRGSLD